MGNETREQLPSEATAGYKKTCVLLSERQMPREYWGGNCRGKTASHTIVMKERDLGGRLPGRGKDIRTGRPMLKEESIARAKGGKRDESGERGKFNSLSTDRRRQFFEGAGGRHDEERPDPALEDVVVIQETS